MSRIHNILSGIDKDFHEIVSNEGLLREACEKYLDKLIDNITIGIVLSVHRSKKTRIIEVEKEPPPEDDGHRPCVDIFGPYNFKKKYECLCRNCDRIVGASGFAPHLEKCMGMGRSRSRNASRRVANNSRERENSSYSGIPSDDEDDMDWNSGDKRKKKKDKNGNKKLKSNSKKITDVDAVDSINIDIEGEAEDLLNLRDLLRDFSRGPSPADSVSSSGSTKRRDRPKSKKRRDKSSPNSNSSLMS